ncbi:MAG: type II secretion system protein [Granulosicoccus sp.]
MNRIRDRGFTLVEMAFVLLIIGLLTKVAIGPLASLQEHGKRGQAEADLQRVREAVFAYLVAYGSLPCPLLAGRSADERPTDINTHRGQGNAQVCGVSSGLVPAYALGLSGNLTRSGALLDPWGREFQYVVSLSSNPDSGNAALPDWTSSGEAANVGIGELSADITLCNAMPRTNCSGRSIRSNQIAFLIMSAGRDGSTRGLQAENQDGDNYFLVTDESILPGAEYDDLLVWGSAADVMYWMLRMGWLP